MASPFQKYKETEKVCLPKKDFRPQAKEEKSGIHLVSIAGRQNTWEQESKELCPFFAINSIYISLFNPKWFTGK